MGVVRGESIREIAGEPMENVLAVWPDLINAIEQDECDDSWNETFNTISDLAGYVEDLQHSFSRAYSARERRLEEEEENASN